MGSVYEKFTFQAYPIVIIFRSVKIMEREFILRLNS